MSRLRKKSGSGITDDYEYNTFVIHPRYGWLPHFTGLNPKQDFVAGVCLHWHDSVDSRVPNTAVAADLTKQTPSTMPVTHYYDVVKTCRDCDRLFLFFALEQKYWYEELGFPLESGCGHCPDCRRRRQHVARQRRRFEELYHVADRSTDQNLEMAETCLTLIEQSVFHKRQVCRVRMLLNRVSAVERVVSTRHAAIVQRLHCLESRR